MCELHGEQWQILIKLVFCLVFVIGNPVFAIDKLINGTYWVLAANTHILQIQGKTCHSIERVMCNIWLLKQHSTSINVISIMDPKLLFTVPACSLLPCRYSAVTENAESVLKLQKMSERMLDQKFLHVQSEHIFVMTSNTGKPFHWHHEKYTCNKESSASKF